MTSQFSYGDRTNGMRQGRRAEYIAPRLVEYGGLRDITLYIDNGHKRGDNGTPASSNKTPG